MCFLEKDESVGGFFFRFLLILFQLFGIMWKIVIRYNHSQIIGGVIHEENLSTK